MKEDNKMDLDLGPKMSFAAFSAITENMFADDGISRFHEIVATDGGPQLFMLTGEFTNDTWSIFEGLGPVARKSVVIQKEADALKRWPGMCLLFGLSMTALAQIASRLDSFPEHIKEDFLTLPRNEENETD